MFGGPGGFRQVREAERKNEKQMKNKGKQFKNKEPAQLYFREAGKNPRQKPGKKPDQQSDPKPGKKI